MKKVKNLTVFFVLSILVFTACNSNEAMARKTLNLAITNEVTSLNSLSVTSADSAQVIANFLEGLTTYSSRGDVISGIAEDWKISADGLVYTFNLREAYWQDEVPVKAQDFVFAWQQLASLPDAPYREHLRNFANGPAILNKEKAASELGVKALSDRKLEITLMQPMAYLIELLAFPAFLPVREDFYKKVGAKNYGTSPATVLANGPFQLTAYDGAMGYTLMKNLYYWDVANVDVQQVHVRVVKDASTRANLYESGEIDQLVLTADVYDKYVASPDLVSESQPRMNFLYLSKNVDPDNSILISYNMRAAIAHAIDKELLVKTIVKDGSVAADYFLPRDFVTLDNEDFRSYSGQYNTLAFDVAKAQEYFEKAKYELVGKELILPLSFSDNPVTKKMFENIKDQLERNLFGLKVELQSYPQASYISTLKQNTPSAANIGWIGGFRDPSTFFEVYQTGKLQNYGFYSNLTFDDLIQQTESKKLALNPKKRWDAFVQAEKILLADCYLIPLYQQGQVSLIKPNIHGLKLNSTIPSVLYKYVSID